jgi:hypothetical protein
MLARFRSIHLVLVALVASVALVVPAQPTYAADTEIAHVWRFTYQQSSGAGLLDVRIVEQEVDTHEIVAVLEEFVYPAPCTQNGNAITCELDIKAAIVDSYIQMDLKEEAAKVRPNESYRWMITETTGRWHSIPANTHATVASHSSLNVAVTTNSSSRVRFLSNWNVINSASPFMKITTGQSHTMRNEFDCEQPQSTDCTISNWLIAGGRVQLLNSSVSAVSTVGFVLTPNEITLTPPNGYQLESFVIDPPKAGYG